MRTKEVKIPEFWPWISYKGNWRKIKSCGIREPKKRVKGYRVEIRPPNSKQKIWVGTFASWTKAMRAFDAAVYLVGKDPYYYVYPKDYFPNRPSRHGLKEVVQAEAKKYAEKTDNLSVNPLSLHSDTSTGVPRGLTIPESVESHQLTSMDSRVTIPTHANLTNIAEEVDKELLIPTEQEVFDGEAKVPAAYLRGLNAPNPSVVNDLLVYPPPESFNVFPYIQGEESILDVFEEKSSTKLTAFKSNRESPDPLADQFNGTLISWSTLESLGNVALPEYSCTNIGDGRLVEAYDHSMEDWNYYQPFEPESGYSNGIWPNTSP